MAPEPLPPPVLSLEAGGPWPLPCYRVAGEFSVDNCDLDWERLSSLIGGGPGSTYKTDSAGVQSSWEPSESSSPPPSGPRRRKKLEALTDGEESAEEPHALVMRQLSLRRTRPLGDKPLDTQDSTRPRLSECPGPVSSSWRNAHLVFSGLRCSPRRGGAAHTSLAARQPWIRAGASLILLSATILGYKPISSRK